jgi:hypothetical protein
MSMHDVEDVMERAARLLDRTEHPNLRTLYAGLFDDFANLPIIDVGAVPFRLLDILFKHHYAYRITGDITQFPYRWLGYDRDGDPVKFCFLGDVAWEQLVKDGLLTGRDAEPRTLTLDDPLILTRLVLLEAEKDSDRDFIARWYPALLIWLQFTTDDHELLEVAANPLLHEIMEIVERNAASTPPDGYTLSEYFSDALPLTPESFVHGTLQARRDAE